MLRSLTSNTLLRRLGPFKHRSVLHGAGWSVIMGNIYPTLKWKNPNSWGSHRVSDGRVHSHKFRHCSSWPFSFLRKHSGALFSKTLNKAFGRVWTIEVKNSRRRCQSCSMDCNHVYHTKSPVDQVRIALFRKITSVSLLDQPLKKVILVHSS